MNDKCCGNCLYWESSTEELFNVCRRFPPTIVNPTNGIGLPIIMFNTQWCGEFKEKENNE